MKKFLLVLYVVSTVGILLMLLDLVTHWITANSSYDFQVNMITLVFYTTFISNFIALAFLGSDKITWKGLVLVAYFIVLIVLFFYYKEVHNLPLILCGKYLGKTGVCF